MSEVTALRRGDDIAQILDMLVRADGSYSHSYLAQASQDARSRDGLGLPDLADAAYYLCLLHGRHPGVINHAATRSVDNAARRWLIEAADAFARERAYLTQVTVAAGPAPSTAGQSSCETIISQQRHALDMLAQSDRAGCATGAAIALAIDWVSIRSVLDRAAASFGLVPAPARLPIPEETVSVVDALAREAAHERAMLFGAQQVFAQHRGLWDLLEARASARSRG